MSGEEGSHCATAQDRWNFGVSTTHQNINFVSGLPDPATTNVLDLPSSQDQSYAEDYISIVLNKKRCQCSNKKEIAVDPWDSEPPLSCLRNPRTEIGSNIPKICPICHLQRLATRQVDGDALITSPTKPKADNIFGESYSFTDHSHPPSHLDRSRFGFKYLHSHGWDPDRRIGLGADGEGRREPIKLKVKNNTVGLGLECSSRKAGKSKDVRQESSCNLNAGKIRKRYVDDRKRTEILTDLFYGRDDVNRYLYGDL